MQIININTKKALEMLKILKEYDQTTQLDVTKKDTSTIIKLSGLDYSHIGLTTITYTTTKPINEMYVNGISYKDIYETFKKDKSQYMNIEIDLKTNTLTLTTQNNQYIQHIEQSSKPILKKPELENDKYTKITILSRDYKILKTDIRNLKNLYRKSIIDIDKDNKKISFKYDSNLDDYEKREISYNYPSLAYVTSIDSQKEVNQAMFNIEYLYDKLLVNINKINFMDLKISETTQWDIPTIEPLELDIVNDDYRLNYLLAPLLSE